MEGGTLNAVSYTHLSSDLYVKITKESTRIIDEYYAEHPELKKTIFVSIFESSIPPHYLWYDIAFAYDPFWEEANKKCKRQEQSSHFCSWRWS